MLIGGQAGVGKMACKRADSELTNDYDSDTETEGEDAASGAADSKMQYSFSYVAKVSASRWNNAAVMSSRRRR